jgi:hypothetical protein
MANQHIEWLLEGVEAWNTRREREPFTPNLSETEFSKSGELWERFVAASMTSDRGLLLRGADFRDAQLHETNFVGADLREAKLDGVQFAEAILDKADFRGATFQETIFYVARLSETDIRTVNSRIYTGEEQTVFRTDLSSVRYLTQIQLGKMRGDRGVILPEGLSYPDHWPEPPEPAASGQNKPPISNLALEIRQRPVSAIRKALTESYPEASSMAQFAAAQIQSEIAAHRMLPIPNEPDALSDYNARLNFLTETLVIIQELHSALPNTRPSEITDGEANSVREKLVALAQQLNRAIAQLDAHPGTYGNLWKMGIVGLCTQLLGLFGIGAALAVPVAAGVVGVSTLRLVIERKGRNTGGPE